MDLQERSATINAMVYDLRAEYLVAYLLAEGMAPRDILVLYKGVLKRRWSTDIDHSEVESFENGQEALALHLNRAGVYDSLPEALFHHFPPGGQASASDMAKSSMKLKLEEKQVRSFFRPFENEIFYRKAQVAMRENHAFRSLQSDHLPGLVPAFWKIDERIPLEYAKKLTCFLPFAHRIAGDYELTARCLARILDEHVAPDYREDPPEYPDMLPNSQPGQPGCLGNGHLGVDFIAGQTASGYYGRLLFKIGPLKNTNPVDFFENGPADLLINCFYGFFIPAEVDVETKFFLEPEKEGFLLMKKGETEKRYLGYNTVL